MKDTERTFVLAALVVFFLLSMHAMPKIHIGKTELRSVNILSDLIPEKDNEDVDVIPAPKAPKTLTEVKTKEGKSIDFKEIWPKGVEPIVDYSGGAAGGMESFYAALAKVKSMNRPVRIAFFGDSYVEGDIMTADLRESFQKEFGGNGVGWVDLANPNNRNARRTVTQTTSGTREFAVVKKPFDSNKEGIAQRYYTVSNGAKVTTDIASVFNRFQPHSKSFQVAHLYFRAPAGATITASVAGHPQQSQSFGGSQAVQMMTTKVPGTKITYSFPRVGSGFAGFGMALESNKGVILDCISMRGSNGLTLKDIPAHTLADFARLRPYDLIVIQYGLNVAVVGNPPGVMKAYANNMKKAVANLRLAYPHASFLILSVPDHDQRSANGITTLKEVKQLVSYQQQLAADCHVAFLNLYKAMGGQGSMKKLVDQNMANKDYTHLSFGGGKYVAGKVYPSFRAGYKNYQRKKKLEQE